MGKFDGYLICTDLDGTFTVGHEICGENAKYVKYFQENGGLFTVSTGRLLNHLDEFKDFKPNCPVITHNGAVISDLENKEVLYKKTFSKECIELYDYVSENTDIRLAVFNGLNDFVDVADFEQKKDTELFKLVFRMDSEKSTYNLRAKLIEKFGDKYSIFLGWSLGVECLAKDANKGTAVLKLKEILGDRVKKVICVGDSESDTFMLKCADIGYAVANASEETKLSADRITVDYKQGAIAEIIKDIEKEL